MDYQHLLNQLIDSNDLSKNAMQDLMQAIMTGKLDDAKISAVLIALRIKGESIEELTAAAKVMRNLAQNSALNQPNLIDIVGTGGDSQNTFNVSTTTCFVVAACGGVIAKHGNRSVSSKSGSADLLEMAGVNIELSAQQVASCIEKCQLGFLFAPMHHKAMKHAIGVRKSLGVRTLFNLLGPLTNPANAKSQLIGVYQQQLIEPFAKVLQNLGSENAMVVHSQDGLDEISISAQTNGIALRDGQLKPFTLNPRDYNCYHPSLEPIRVNSPKESLAMMKSVLNADKGPAYDIVTLNAAAALYCANLSQSFSQGVELAREAIDSGKALNKLNQLIEITQAMK